MDAGLLRRKMSARPRYKGDETRRDEDRFRSFSRRWNAHAVLLKYIGTPGPMDTISARSRYESRAPSSSNNGTMTATPSNDAGTNPIGSAAGGGSARAAPSAAQSAANFIVLKRGLAPGGRLGREPVRGGERRPERQRGAEEEEDGVHIQETVGHGRGRRQAPGRSGVGAARARGETPSPARSSMDAIDASRPSSMRRPSCLSPVIEAANARLRAIRDGRDPLASPCIHAPRPPRRCSRTHRAAQRVFGFGHPCVHALSVRWSQNLAKQAPERLAQKRRDRRGGHRRRGLPAGWAQGRAAGCGGAAMMMHHRVFDSYEDDEDESDDASSQDSDRSGPRYNPRCSGWLFHQVASREQTSTICKLWRGAQCATCGARVGLSHARAYEAAVANATKAGDVSRLSSLLLHRDADEASSSLFNSALATAARLHIGCADLLLDATPRRCTAFALHTAKLLSKHGERYGGHVDLERVETLFRDERLQIGEPYHAITSCAVSLTFNHADIKTKDKTAADERWLELILERVDPNAVEPKSRGPYFYESQAEYYRRGKESLHVGSTPLFYALEFGFGCADYTNGGWDPTGPRTWLFNRLVDHPRIDLDRTARHDGMTPLHLATFQGNMHCVRALLRRGASPDFKLRYTEGRHDDAPWFTADDEAWRLCVYSVHRAWGGASGGHAGTRFYPNELVPAERFNEIRDKVVDVENWAFNESTTKFLAPLGNYGKQWNILDAGAFSLDDMILLYAASTGRSATARAVRSARMWERGGSLIALRELFRRGHEQSADRVALRTVCFTSNIFASILAFASLPAPRALDSLRLQRYLRSYDPWHPQRQPFDYVKQSRLRIARLAAETITATLWSRTYDAETKEYVRAEQLM